MSWLEELSRVYDTHQHKIGITETAHRDAMLLPIFHSSMQAQIEISLSAEGEFISARRLEKDERGTLIPVTEDSATRSSGCSPMPLCDKLKYVAGDYAEQIEENISSTEGKNNKKDSKTFYDAYMAQLQQWAESPEAVLDVKAIYAYLKKGCLIKDLKKQGVFEAESDVVRFLVYTDPDLVKGVWEKPEVFDSFIKWYGSRQGEKSLCYITGNQEVVATKFPAKLRHSGDKSKLISSNDTSGFTYRGRFINASDAVSVGYVLSEKAHNALRWLITRQGYSNGSEKIVSWLAADDTPMASGSERDIVHIMEGSERNFRRSSHKVLPEAGINYVERLNKAIAGYRMNLSTNAKIMTMAVDTADGAGQGRLSIPFYCELQSSEFYRNIENWFRDLSWELKYYDEETKQYHRIEGSPSPLEIVRTAFGVEQSGKLTVDAKQQKKEIDRLLPCILQGKPFPKDMLLAAVRNTGSPQRFKADNWDKILRITCAMIRKNHAEERRSEEMALDRERRDRSYLFGRLLAVADQTEGYVYYRDNVDRETNAKKYWSTFSRTPAKTWQILEEKLKPYETTCLEKWNRSYDKVKTEIMSLFDEDERFDNTALNENYLLGYYNQLAELRKKKEEE